MIDGEIYNQATRSKRGDILEILSSKMAQTRQFGATLTSIA